MASAGSNGQSRVGQTPWMMARDVVVLPPDARVSDAAKRLSKTRSGVAVVVDADEKVVGVLTNTDIVKVTAKWPTEIANLKITHLYTKTPVTCAESDDAASVMKLMVERDFRYLPLVDGDRLKGLISVDNLRNFLTDESANVADAIGPGSSDRPAAGDPSDDDDEPSRPHPTIKSFMRAEDFHGPSGGARVDESPTSKGPWARIRRARGGFSRFGKFIPAAILVIAGIVYGLERRALSLQRILLP